MLLDQQTRDIAVDPGKSFIVQAPAGSGKTSLLVSRFVKLLAKVKNPESCLAITFTKKAAAEMKIRVLGVIKDLITSPEFSSLEIYHQVLSNPNKLQILTIDALCGQIVAKTPWESNVYFNYSINEDADSLYQSAVEQFLTIINDEVDDPCNKELQQHLIKLYQYFDNDYDRVYSLLKMLLQKREQWLPIIMPFKLMQSQAIQTEEYTKLRLLLENNLQLAITEVLQDIYNYLPSVDIQQNILTLADYAANNVHESANPISNLKKLNNIWPAPNYDNLRVWQGLASLILNQDGSPRSSLNKNQGFLPASKIKDPVQKQLILEYKGLFKTTIDKLIIDHSEFLYKLFKLKELPLARYQEDNWEMLASLLELLPNLVAYLSLVFADNKQVDFTQITIAALEALGSYQDPSSLALTLQQQIQHILIDEFQDTSLLQYRLIEHLLDDWEINGSKTIFIVGDPMQSIYRFRQADVSLFLKVQHYGIANIKLANLFLTSNFRSTGSIVNNLNKLFVNIFPKNDDWLHHGIKYTPCYASSKLNENACLNNFNLDFLGAKQGIINQDLHLILTNNPEEEALQIVELINRLHDLEFDLKIGVLFRSRNHAAHIIAALKKHGIDYQSNDLELLLDNVCVMDLHMLTRAIMHLHDPVAWLALLRGPLVGLLLQDLNILLEGRETQSILYGLQSYRGCKSLSLDAIHRLDYIVPILIKAFNNRQFINLATIVKKTWEALGGYLIVPSKDLYLIEEYLYHIAAISDPYNLVELDQSLAKAKAGLDVEKLKSTTVQLMTIHKSKGLEFDIVILPRMNQFSQNATDPLLLWEEKSFLSHKTLTTNNGHGTNYGHNSYVIFAPLKSAQQKHDAIYNFIKNTKSQQQAYEAQRLLYVAISRAKQKFFGFTASENIANKSFFKLIERYIEPEQLIKAAVHSPEDLTEFTSDVQAEDMVILERIPTAWYIK